MFEGTATLEGQDLLNASDDELRRLRGEEIAMIFQDPMTSLNPVQRIGVADRRADPGAPRHGLARRRYDLTVELLERVGIPRARERIRSYPHEFSGGMRQRVMIAMALSCDPSVLIADEPTTALDVTIQAQILEVMQELRERTDAGIVLVTHDLGVVADIADRIARDVRGARRRAGDGRRDLLRPAAPVHLGPAGLDRPRGPAAARAPPVDPGPAAVAAQPARRAATSARAAGTSSGSARRCRRSRRAIPPRRSTPTAAGCRSTRSAPSARSPTVRSGSRRRA